MNDVNVWRGIEGTEFHFCPFCICAGDLVQVQPFDGECPFGHDLTSSSAHVGTITKVDQENRSITIEYDAEVHCDHPMWKGTIR